MKYRVNDFILTEATPNAHDTLESIFIDIIHITCREFKSRFFEIVNEAKKIYYKMMKKICLVQLDAKDRTAFLTISF